MNSTQRSLALAAAVGGLTGIRSVSGAAVLSHAFSRNVHRRYGLLEKGFSSRLMAGLLKTLAAGEAAADKSSAIPPRTDAGPLGGRIAMGALCGFVLAHHLRGPVLAAAAVGGAAALGAAYSAYHLRKYLTAVLPVPDPLVGAAEDALVVSAGAKIVAALKH